MNLPDDEWTKMKHVVSQFTFYTNDYSWFQWECITLLIYTFTTNVPWMCKKLVIWLSY
jgi:hypothetical protein